jgi:hypothetical protein
MRDDLHHLRLLSIFHYVVAGLSALCGSIPIIHLVMGVGILMGWFDQQSVEPPPPLVGWLFVVIGGAGVLFGWAFAVCMAVAGSLLNRHKGYLFCLVMAGIACLVQPFGTVLGVFTILVLSRPSVKELFGRGVSGPAEPGAYSV